MATTNLGFGFVCCPLSVVNSASFILSFLLVNMENPQDQIEPDAKLLLSSSEIPDHMDDWISLVEICQTMDLKKWVIRSRSRHSWLFKTAYGLE